ncbi:hypothetical protein ERM42_12190 [Clostridioides difficile]|uniref:hypothetical protein n=1 Tax=Clostridioides difficile TaxID=1496 RepID=UPI0009468396|nr:hypothetical protein [Clostridioides difficile]EGT3903103.1 hypothetical protein [Clostridioides difficile]ELX4523408.1 hypothetical protein [Clostridioides difficile]MCO8788031.1 hypothetical protein [Clostridioides difficile]MCO8827978.1 hypothetical protein [Clostridioides difficile]MCW0845037.1 hypothetical protein [Clostridioides difficile]
MKNFIKEVKLFILSNKILTLAFCIATIIFVSYEVTKDLPEIIPYGDFIFNLLSQLSLSFMGCFVFYIMQIYIPENKNKKILKENLKSNLNYVLRTMLNPIWDVLRPYLDKIDDMLNLSEEEFKSIEIRINLSEKIYLKPLSSKKEISNHEYIIIYIKEVENKINKINMRFGVYLDVELTKLLDDIENSSYHRNFPKIDSGYPSNIYMPFFREYIDLCKKLKTYLENM